VVVPLSLATPGQERDGTTTGAIIHPPARWLAPAVILSFDLVALLSAVAVAGSPPLALVYAGFALSALVVSHAYQVRITLRALDDTPWLVGRLAIALVLLAPIGLLTGTTDVLLRVAALGVVFAVVGRVLSLAVLRHLRCRGVLSEPTIILGGGKVGAEIARVLCEDRSYGAAPIGFVDSISTNMPLPVLGDIDELDRIVDRYQVRRMIVAFGPARDVELVKVLRSALQHDIEVHIVPRFFDCGIAPEGPDTDDIGGISLYRVRRAALRAPAWIVKRVLDVVIAGTCLGVSAPILGLVALAVKFSSPGPILFRQRRVGQNGREFDVLKFRTLRDNDQSDTQWSVIGDTRFTPIGRFLRRTSLDELPQLWSVVRGDMSLVGPRPERPFFSDRFSTAVEGYKHRHRLPVGLTGWAQVHGLRGDTSIEARARFDNHYIENWSIWRDFVILGRTAVEVMRSVRGPDR
jgi:exopolysaccharide biosynthesis polyprenyl glycosylphosphotransferase